MDSAVQAVRRASPFHRRPQEFTSPCSGACLKENSVTPPNVDMDRHRANGRFRMCANLMLRRRALKVGYVVISAKKVTAPGAKKASLNSGSVTPVFVRIYNIYKAVEYRFESGEVYIVGIGPYDLVGEINLTVTPVSIKFVVRIERLPSQNGALDLIAKAILYL